MGRDQERAPTCKENGFTLLELIIALAILTVGLLAVGTMQGVALNANTKAYRMTEATNLAQDRIEYLTTLPYATLTTGNNLPDPDPHNPCDDITYDVTPAMTNLKGNVTAWRITMRIPVQGGPDTVLDYIRSAVLDKTEIE